MMSRSFLDFLLLITAMLATPAWAQEKCLVKLEFENITHEQVSALINETGVPAIVAASWQSALNKFPTKPPKGKIAKYDLNGDGIEETILYLSGTGMCGQGGCHLIFFQLDPENEKLAYQTARSGSADILILDDRSNNGFHNIAIKPRDKTGLPTANEYTRYRWKNGDLKQTDEIIRFQHRSDHCD